MTTLKVVGAVLDERNLTLYTVKDGKADQIIIPQGDARLKPILDAILSDLNLKGEAQLNIDLLETQQINVFKEMEKKTNGFVRFYAIARTKLKSLFGSDKADNSVSASPQTFGQVPLSQEEAIAAIMAQAEPLHVSHDVESARPLVDAEQRTDNSHPTMTSEHTVVAVVENVGIVPNAELLQNQFHHAVNNTAKGTTALLERMARMQSTRQHTVQDLLTFLERADIPIMDDGSLLVYKVLRRVPENRTFSNVSGQLLPHSQMYMDCHSRRVPQWVGATVCMDESLVDSNRSIDCSYGLHIARRGYLGSFSGDVCVLSKVNPEDVIAVPRHDANKVRVCAYTVLHELSDHHFRMLKSNRPLTADTEGQALLGRLLANKYPEPTHKVVLLDKASNSIRIDSLVTANTPPETAVIAPTEEPVLIQAIPDTLGESVAPTVSVKQVIAGTRKEQANNLFQSYIASRDPADLQVLLDFKKKARKSWDALGIPDPTTYKWDTSVPSTEKVVQPEPSKKDKPLTNQEKVKLYLTMLDPEHARKILEIKKKTKYAWSYFGISGEQAVQILELAKK